MIVHTLRMFAMCLFALSGVASAQTVYKCNVKGAIVYSDAPCVDKKKEAQSCKATDGHWSEAACTTAPAAGIVKRVPDNWTPTIGMRKEEIEAVVFAMSEQCEDASKHAPIGGTDDRHPFPHGDWAVCSYPTVNKTTTASGVHEQWVFGDSGSRKYLYIENGVVTSIQD